MHPTQGWQWLLGTFAKGVWPYTRCRGSSGQVLLHQPLLPLNAIPAMKAPMIVSNSSTLRPAPLVLKKAMRVLVIPKNRTIEMRAPYRRSQSGGVSARVKLNHRGAWLEAASGQMLRHSPGAVKNRIGSRGTITLKNQNCPPAGRMNSATHSAR